MDKKTFKEKVQKQLWFLNKKEKEQLNKKLSQLDSEDNVDFNKPIQFSNRYLKNHIYEHKVLLQVKPLYYYLVLL